MVDGARRDLASQKLLIKDHFSSFLKTILRKYQKRWRVSSAKVQPIRTEDETPGAESVARAQFSKESGRFSRAPAFRRVISQIWTSLACTTIKVLACDRLVKKRLLEQALSPLQPTCIAGFSHHPFCPTLTVDWLGGGSTGGVFSY